MRKKLTAQETILLYSWLDALQTCVVAQDGEVTAEASDGVRVVLGNAHYAPESLLRYLKSHPTPDTW